MRAFAYAASDSSGIQTNTVAIRGWHTSSRCYQRGNLLVQKLIRAGFGTITSIPAPGSATPRRLRALHHVRKTSAGNQDFDSVEHTDVVLISAPIDDGHRCCLEHERSGERGAKLIVIDPTPPRTFVRSTQSRQTPLPMLPGTNVAVLTALAHVIAPRASSMKPSCASVATGASSRIGPHSWHCRRTARRRPRIMTGVDRKKLRGAARLFRQRLAMARSITGSASPSTARVTTVHRDRQLAMATAI